MITLKIYQKWLNRYDEQSLIRFYWGVDINYFSIFLLLFFNLISDTPQYFPIYNEHNIIYNINAVNLTIKSIFLLIHLKH